MTRTLSTAMALCVTLLATGRTEAAGKPARFAGENPKQVESVTAEVKLEVDDELLSTSDVWVAIIPLAAPSSLYLQGTKIAFSPDERIVYLGQEGVVLPRPERFKAVLIAVPKGTFTRDGEVRFADATELGVKIVDQITILRSK